MRILSKLLILGCFALTACNSVYIKPNTIDPNEKFFATRGGYSMRKSVKERMEKRNYNVVVGKSKTSRTVDDYGDSQENISINIDEIPNNTRYVVRVYERREVFMPLWCAFNGFWWWNFNISIADQKTSDEILAWRGQGCANSSLRKLDSLLDKLEK